MHAIPSTASIQRRSADTQSSGQRDSQSAMLYTLMQQPQFDSSDSLDHIAGISREVDFQSINIPLHTSAPEDNIDLPESQKQIPSAVPPTTTRTSHSSAQSMATFAPAAAVTLTVPTAATTLLGLQGHILICCTGKLAGLPRLVTQLNAALV